MVPVRWFTDPACAASWAAEPVLRRLMVEFGADLSFTYVMGGLAREIADPPWGAWAGAELWTLAADWKAKPVRAGAGWLLEPAS